jgi:uncharacterized iron-regulated membrane protein
MTSKTEKLAAWTRIYRRIHRFVAISMFAFMFVIGLTGVLLGWKKQANLSPPTLDGITTDASRWLPIDSLQNTVNSFVKDSLREDVEVDRIDIRPGKGIAKFIFVKHYNEVQVDCTSGIILSARKRHNDFIEHLHDGTVVDRLLGTGDEQFKTTYTTLTSLGLMFLAFTGFWLWRNPKRMRRLKHAGD